MKVKVANWKVVTLYRLREKINSQPSYQRGEVWKGRKKALLIDSMLRGIDIPKIYLRKLESDAYEYEVADGQQRLTAIIQYLEDGFSLLDDEEKGLNLRKVDGRIVGGKKFSELSVEFQASLKTYEVSVAIIEEASNHDIRTLFGRLQEGEPLVPAEKRNAIISKVGSIIDTYAGNHRFFQTCRIPFNRFKWQDFLSHAFALVLYRNRGPLKAALLLEMYLDKTLACDHATQKEFAEILDSMQEIDRQSTTRIHKKYHFIDIFFYLHRNAGRIGHLNPRAFAEVFDELEVRRLGIEDPDSVLSDPETTIEMRETVKYYWAFKHAGAESESINKRQEVFDSLFNNCFYAN